MKDSHVATFVYVQEYGQLCNRLLLFSRLIASAIEHRCRLVNLSFTEYAPYFQTTCLDLGCRYPAGPSWLPRGRKWRRACYLLAHHGTKRLPAGTCGRFRLLDLTDESAAHLHLDSADFGHTLRSGETVLIRGWKFFAHEALEKHAATIRAYFTPLQQYQDHIAETIAHARQGCDLLVGVHIRQGDYHQYVGGRYLVPTASYQRVMQQTAMLFPGQRVGFLVCSNVPQPPDAFAPLSVTQGPGHLIEDLYSLARCDYLIGVKSTYALWAAFYGQIPMYTILDPMATPTLEQFYRYPGERWPTALQEA